MDVSREQLACAESYETRKQHLKASTVMDLQFRDGRYVQTIKLLV